MKARTYHMWAALGIVVLLTLSSAANPVSTANALATATPFGGGIGKVVFTLENTGVIGIVLTDSDGSAIGDLVIPPPPQGLIASIVYSPKWSPDKTRVAYFEETDDETRICIINVSSRKRMCLNNSHALGFGLSWSPDGKSLAYVSGDKQNYDIYRINIDTEQRTRLTTNDAADTHPSWSLSGEKIAFVSERSGKTEIFTMQADGTNLRQLTVNSNSAAPAWSPDGTKIAFTSNRNGNWDIYVMNSDGTDPHQLTDDSSIDGSPTWSPDGKHITFASTWRDSRESHLYVMDTDGKNLHIFAKDYVIVGYEPSWA